MATCDEAFRAGDYVSVARTASPEEWQYWAARALLGLTDAAVEHLLASPSREALLYAGIAAWMAGDDERAVAILGAISGGARGDQAARLRSLIAQDRIDVLAQLPWNRAGSWDLLGSLRDPKFRVHNVSFHRDDVQNRPYADVHALVPAGVRPDFYVVQMVEWHLIPPNVRELECPLIGQSSDFDLHIQCVHPWLAQFDQLVACDSTEWARLRTLGDAPVTTFAKSFGVPNQLPEPPSDDRTIDLLLSGTLFHPFHLDKDATLRPLFGLRGVRMRVHSGFSSFDEYLRDLADSKVTCTYIRHPGAMPTRALEALAMGCAVAVQHESVLRLFAGESEGVFAFRTPDELSKIVARVVAEWDEVAPRARRGAKTVRRALSLPVVASQYLRFMTVLASRGRQERVAAAPASLVQKRPIVQKGWLPSYAFGGPLLRRWAQASSQRLKAHTVDAATPQPFIDLSREELLDRYHDALGADDPAWLSNVTEPLETALQLFPDALVARTNLIRALVHFGGPASVTRALAMLDATLEAPANQWRVRPHEDVLPWDFAPSMFNYRRYFDLVTAVLGGADGGAQFADVILASLAHYRSHYCASVPGPLSDIEYAHAAVTRDPLFDPYVLHYCRLLLERGLPRDCDEAAGLLRRCAESSLLVWDVLDLSRRLPRALQGPWTLELSAAAEMLWRSSTLQEDRAPLQLRRADTHTVHGSGDTAGAPWIDQLVREETVFVDAAVRTGATAVAAAGLAARGCVLAVPRDGATYFHVRQRARAAAAGRLRCVRLDLDRHAGWEDLGACIRDVQPLDLLRLRGERGELAAATPIVRRHRPTIVFAGGGDAEKARAALEWLRDTVPEGRYETPGAFSSEADVALVARPDAVT